MLQCANEGRINYVKVYQYHIGYHVLQKFCDIFKVLFGDDRPYPNPICSMKLFHDGSSTMGGEDNANPPPIPNPPLKPPKPPLLLLPVPKPKPTPLPPLNPLWKENELILLVLVGHEGKLLVLVLVVADMTVVEGAAREWNCSLYDSCWKSLGMDDDDEDEEEECE